MNRETFEREFHSRTLAYQPAYKADTRPVFIHVDRDASCAAGHALVLGLINQLARAHQHIAIVGPLDGPLQCPTPFGAMTASDATVRLARAINPFITVMTTPPHGDAIATLALGRAAPNHSVDLRVGCDRWCATFGDDVRIGEDGTSTLGAMLASSITAGYAFHRLLGPTSKPAGSYSLWEFGATGDAQGPMVDKPVHVGRVLQVGAGGVGASLDFWLALLGIDGEWTVCDGDSVDVSNLNRQLAFLAHHTGYLDVPAVNKAVAAAHLLGAAASPDEHWYGETKTVVDGEYDVVLALANEHGVRNMLQQRQPPVLLHATTSPNWEAQFHRHIAGIDDCITCRLPGNAPVTRCAEAQIDTTTSTDAALPFLSGTAGLMLLVGLLRLQHGALASASANHTLVNLGAGKPLSRELRRTCAEGCTGWASAGVRRAVGISTRYAQLDPGCRAA
jgi:hypothetical protein